MKLKLRNEHYDFFRRIVFKPCFQDLRTGTPLTEVLVWVYLLGLWHGQQLTPTPKTGEAEEK